jgi:hypothetical protein
MSLGEVTAALVVIVHQLAVIVHARTVTVVSCG